MCLAIVAHDTPNCESCAELASDTFSCVCNDGFMHNSDNTACISKYVYCMLAINMLCSGHLSAVVVEPSILDSSCPIL